jgi:hypothetical protein
MILIFRSGQKCSFQLCNRSFSLASDVVGRRSLVDLSAFAIDDMGVLLVSGIYLQSMVLLLIDGIASTDKMLSSASSALPPTRCTAIRRSMRRDQYERIFLRDGKWCRPQGKRHSYIYRSAGCHRCDPFCHHNLLGLDDVSPTARQTVQNFCQ